VRQPESGRPYRQSREVHRGHPVPESLLQKLAEPFARMPPQGVVATKRMLNRPLIEDVRRLRQEGLESVGELPLQAEAMKAFESLMTPSFEEIEDVPFAAEKSLLSNMKTLFLILAGAGVQKHMDNLANEQEILMAAADLSIQIFALESALLRAEKNYESASERKKELYLAAVKVFAFEASEIGGTAARKGAFYVEEGDTLTMILSGVRRFTKYDATGLLAAKRLLADTACEEEKYIF